MQEIDLSNCDREPIHIPGSIQPRGVLLAVDQQGIVVQASRNTDRLLGLPLEQVVGRPCEDVLGLSPADERDVPLTTRPLFIDQRRIGQRVFDVLAHRNPQELAICELEPVDSEDPARCPQCIGMLTTAVAKLQAAEEIPALLQTAVEEFRRLTGYDRVMAYRFDDDFHGAVVAESRREDVHSFLEQHFPASDIPAQARELYRQNRLRIIWDVDYEPVTLSPEVLPDIGEPLDLSHALLRSVSPIHIEYLQNMDVAATLTGSLVVDDRLWGMLACHHTKPKNLPTEVRVACGMLCEVLSLQIQFMEVDRRRRSLIRAHEAKMDLLRVLSDVGDTAAGLRHHLTHFRQLFNCGGVALCHRDECTLLGDAPTETQLRDLVQWLTEQNGGPVFATDHLAEEFPPAGQFADVATGVLAISVDEAQSGFLMWFRPEVVQTITWAGDPNKPVALDGEDQTRISPRKSFAAWKETTRGRSLPWDRSDREMASLLRVSLLHVLYRISDLRTEIAARKVAESQLRAHADETSAANEDLRRFNEMAIGREKRMVELKGEVNQLCRQLGRPEPYKIAASPPAEE